MSLIGERCFSSVGQETCWLYKKRQRDKGLAQCIPPVQTKSRSITCGTSLTVSCAVFATSGQVSVLYVKT